MHKAARIAQYLKMHQENIDDIPMMEMMEVSGKVLSSAASVDGASIELKLNADQDSGAVNRFRA